jgi:hypothetical protein
LNLVAERATVTSTNAKTTGWVALDGVESVHFGDALETGFAELAESHGESASSIIAARGADLTGRGDLGGGVGPARNGSAANDCAKAREYLTQDRQRLDDGKPILGIDKRGNVKVMTSGEAEHYFGDASNAVDFMCN